MKTRSTRRSAGLAALGCLLPVLALAQQPVPSESLAAARSRAVAALRPGQVVRLQVRGDGRVQARFLGLAGDTVLLGDSAAPRRVPAPAIASLWVRGRRTTLGAVVGGTVMGVADASLFYVIGQMMCGTEGKAGCRPAAFAVLGGVGGAIGGALMGGAIGTLFPRWRRGFP